MSKVYLVICPGGYYVFSDKKKAIQFSQDKIASIVELEVDPLQPRSWYVEICLSDNGNLAMYANPGAGTPQEKIFPHAKGIWYCYVNALNGDEAKTKAKKVLIDSFSEY